MGPTTPKSTTNSMAVSGGKRRTGKERGWDETLEVDTEKTPPVSSLNTISLACNSGPSVGQMWGNVAPKALHHHRQACSSSQIESDHCEATRPCWTTNPCWFWDMFTPIQVGGQHAQLSKAEARQVSKLGWEVLSPELENWELRKEMAQTRTAELSLLCWILFEGTGEVWLRCFFQHIWQFFWYAKTMKPWSDIL